MRIVFLVSSLGTGGAERVATTLCSAWAARGDSVTLVPTFSGGGEPFYALHEKIELIYLAQKVVGAKGGGKNYLGRLHALRQIIRERNPDVVVSFLPNVNVAALAATAFSGVPCIVCERSDPSIQPIGWLWRAVCRVVYRFANLVTVQTQAVATSIHHVYGGLKRVAVVPNPLPVDLMHWQARGSRTERKILLSLGRLVVEKQVGLVIESFAQLAPLFPDWDLHIYGEGPVRDALQGRIDALGLRDRVQLQGRASEPWRVMADADVFVMASRYEGFPNALLEAMGVGLPCVTTDCPSGPREITRDGKDALLVGAADGEGLLAALTRLMGDADLRIALGEQARTSVADRYALNSVLSTWDSLFAQVGARV